VIYPQRRGDISALKATVLKPALISMAQPNAITADGIFGVSLATFVITDTGREASTMPHGDRRGGVTSVIPLANR